MRVPFYRPLPPLLSERLCVDLVHLLCACVYAMCARCGKFRLPPEVDYRLPPGVFLKKKKKISPR